MSRSHQRQDAVFAFEFAEVEARFVDVESLDALVEPDFARTESRDAFVFHIDAAHRIACQDVAH